MSDSVEYVPRQLAHGRLLSAAEEVRLARRIERGDRRARELMIEGNLRLVVAVARSYRGRGVPFVDLVQEGTIGLVRAVERFDHRQGVRFSTYAMWWIRSSLVEAITAARPIRIPARAARQLAAVRRAESDLARFSPGTASDEAIAEETGLSPDTVRSLRGTAQVTASLDEPVGDDFTVLGDLVADEHSLDPEARAVENDELRSVPTMLRLLPERHREVLTRRYGLNSGRAQSHHEIGAWLGVGEERSRQLECEALHRLRSVAVPAAA